MSEQQDPMQLDTPVAEHSEDKLVLNSPEQARTPKDFILWAGVLVLAILTVYSPAFHGKFIWDDARHVAQNQALRSTAGLERIWTSFRTEPQYYPLTHTSYWVEYQLSAKDANGQVDPLVFHITNAVLHAIAAILLWLVLRRLGLPGAWLIAAIWALHPLQVESVAWISERKNVLSGVFFFGSILAYLVAFGMGGGSDEATERRSDGGGERRRQEARGKRQGDGAFPWGGWVLALGLFVCALLSKTVACSMPAVVLLLIWWKRGRIRRRDALALAPFFVIGLAFALMTARLEVTQVRAVGDDWYLTPAGHILVAGRAIWFYAAKNLWPYPLNFSYFKWHVDGSLPWQWIFPAGVVLVIGGLFAMRRWIGRGPVTAALIFCGVLTPALGFFNVYPMRYSYVADHFQYLAGPALIAAVVVAVVKLLRLVLARHGELHERPAPYVMGAIVLVALGGMSLARARVFTGMIPLWRDVVTKNPQSWMGHYNLGTSLLKDAGDSVHTPDERAKLLKDAAAQFAETVQIRPQHDNAYNNWGKVLFEQGHPDAALAKFHKSLSIDPRNIAAVTNSAMVLADQTKYAQAEKLLRHALELAEDDATAPKSAIHLQLGNVLEKQGRTDAAEREYAAAVTADGKNLAARMDYGRLLRAKKKLIDAANQFIVVRRESPDPRQVLVALLQIAEMQTEVGNFSRARETLEHAVGLARRVDPEFPGLAAAVTTWRARYEAATRPSTTRGTTQGIHEH